MANPRKSNILHKLQNTYRPVDHKAKNAAAGEPGDLGDPPGYWKADAVERREWERLAASPLIRTLLAVDRWALVAWCEAYGDYERASMALAGPDAAAATRKEREQAFSRMRRLANDLGFSPSARTKLSIPDVAPAKDSTWSKMRERSFTVGAAEGKTQ